MSASQIHTHRLFQTLRLEGNKIHCSPRDHSLSYLLYCETEKTKNALRFQRQLQATFNFKKLDCDFETDRIITWKISFNGRSIEIVVNVFIYLFYCYLSFFIHFSNYLGVASLGPGVRSRAPSPSHNFL